MATRKDLWLLALLTCLTGPAIAQESASTSAEVGVRPAYLVDTLEDGALKDKLASCLGQPMEANDWSIGHRGAPLQFPEHSRQSYTAARARASSNATSPSPRIANSSAATPNAIWRRPPIS